MTPKTPWADRFIVYLLVFGMGFITADRLYARQLVSLDRQVGAALAAVEAAHGQMDKLEGCSIRGDSILSAALEAEHE